MQTFRLRVAYRDNRGHVRRPARDDTIEAATVREAIGALLSDAQTLLVEDTNLVWLTDEDGHLVWTLRMDDHNAVST